jgi:hypothetical protein
MHLLSFLCKTYVIVGCKVSPCLYEVPPPPCDKNIANRGVIVDVVHLILQKLYKQVTR